MQIGKMKQCLPSVKICNGFSEMLPIKLMSTISKDHVGELAQAKHQNMALPKLIINSCHTRNILHQPNTLLGRNKP